MTTTTASHENAPPTTPTIPDNSYPYGLTTAAAKLLPAADAILSAHRSDEYGMCAGCSIHHSVMTPYPCSRAAWATNVIHHIPSPETMAVLGWPPTSDTSHRE
jgi:hypothetical protein